VLEVYYLFCVRDVCGWVYGTGINASGSMHVAVAVCLWLETIYICMCLWLETIYIYIYICMYVIYIYTLYIYINIHMYATDVCSWRCIIIFCVNACCVCGLCLYLCVCMVGWDGVLVCQAVGWICAYVCDTYVGVLRVRVLACMIGIPVCGWAHQHHACICVGVCVCDDWVERWGAGVETHFQEIS